MQMSKDIQRDRFSACIAAEIDTALEDVDVLGVDIGVATGDMEFRGDMLVFEEHGRETGDRVVCRWLIQLAIRSRSLFRSIYSDYPPVCVTRTLFPALVIKEAIAALPTRGEP